jgi:hypothetical protein
MQQPSIKNMKSPELPNPKFKLIQRVLFITPRVMDKFNQKNAIQVDFTSSGLESLRKKYRNVKGLPGFLHHFMKGRPTEMRDLILSNPNLCAWTKDYNFIILPNNYNDLDSLVKDPFSVKNSKGGLFLVAWWIAPELLKRYEVSVW